VVREAPLKVGFLLDDRAVHPRHGVLCAGQCGSGLHPHFPILLHRALPRVHELAVHHLGGDIGESSGEVALSKKYFGERVYREIRARRKTEIVKVLLHPSGAMELRFTKPSFKYKAGQWLFLNVPEVSKFQWHPVSGFTSPRLTLVHHIVRSRGPVRVGSHTSGRGLYQSPRSASWRDGHPGELTEWGKERAGLG
jgi:hypothetical protein